MGHRALARAFVVSAVVLAGVSAAQSERRAEASDELENELSAGECMARAMYFESHRSHEDGMLAVGTVVANRLASGRYGDTICEVVGRRSQFAPGVLTRTMSEARPAERARRVADAVLSGQRHPIAGDAMFFHTDNVPFRHDDKRYVLVSGGNAFYKWNREDEEAEANTMSLVWARAEAAEHKELGKRIITAALDRLQRWLTPSIPGETKKTPVVAAVELPVVRTLGPDATTPETKPQAIAAAEPAKPLVVAETQPQAEIAGEIVAAPNLLATALAYRAAPARSPAARQALATVTALKPASPAPAAKGPRVIAPSAPVFASATPVLRAPEPASAKNPMANIVVTQAWSAFEPMRLASK